MVDRPTTLADNYIPPEHVRSDFTENIGDLPAAAPPSDTDEAVDEAWRWWTMETRLDNAVEPAVEPAADYDEFAAARLTDRWERVESIFGAEVTAQLRQNLGFETEIEADEIAADDETDEDAPESPTGEAENGFSVAVGPRWLDDHDAPEPPVAMEIRWLDTDQPLDPGPPPEPVVRPTPVAQSVTRPPIEAVADADLAEADPVDQVAQLTPMPSPAEAPGPPIPVRGSTVRPAASSPGLGPKALQAVAATHGPPTSRRRLSGGVGAVLGWIFIALIIGIGIGYLYTLIRS